MKDNDKLLEELAERLISTLGIMDAAEADSVVKDVATTIMTDVLGKKGYIKKDKSVIACGTFGSKYFSSYEWSEL